MSKVGTASREALNQLKDHYALKERENENKHREEVATVRESGRVEAERVRQEGEERLQRAREEHALKMNEKDLQFRKEVEAIRSMYAKKLIEAKKGSDN